jgi:hypothetical protein
MAREYGPGTWRYVTIAGGAGIKYVFNSKLKDGLKGDFGQTDITSAFNVANAVLSPNRPKPARASKRLSDGYEGSFCSSANIATLRANGYRITPAKFGLANQTTLSRVLYVEINGIKYAWRRPRQTGSNVDLTALGVQDASGETDLVFGADFPKPAQAQIALEGLGSYRSFVDNSKVDGATLDAGASSAGWVLTSPQRISAQELLNLTTGQTAAGA